MIAEYIVFDFADETTLLDKASIVRLLIAIAEGDRFQFLKKAIVCDNSPGVIYVPNSPETLANAWNNAIRAVQRYNGYWMEFEDTDHLKFAFGFDPNAARRLFLSANKSDLRADASLGEFVRIAELIFNTLRPIYGFGLFSYDAHDTPEIGSAPFAAWDYNFFNAALVQQFGREALVRLATGRTADLADGGLLLELSDNPITRPADQELPRGERRARLQSILSGWVECRRR